MKTSKWETQEKESRLPKLRTTTVSSDTSYFRITETHCIKWFNGPNALVWSTYFSSNESNIRVFCNAYLFNYQLLISCAYIWLHCKFTKHLKLFQFWWFRTELWQFNQKAGCVFRQLNATRVRLFIGTGMNAPAQCSSVRYSPPRSPPLRPGLRSQF